MKSLVLIDYISYLLGYPELREIEYHIETIEGIVIKTNRDRGRRCIILFSTIYDSIYLLDRLMIQRL